VQKNCYKVRATLWNIGTMPPLDNPRWEAFAQAIVKGLAEHKPNGKNTAKAAYLAAGYSSGSDRSAIVNASRLMTKVDSVVERIKELQAQALARVDRKLDISRERIGRNLDEASRIARQQENPTAIVAAETALAKIFGLVKTSSTYDPNDLDNAQSAEQLATLLLQSVGLDPPFTAAEIESAGAANDAFVGALERIKEDRLVDQQIS
jgi:hypothetical protein